MITISNDFLLAPFEGRINLTTHTFRLILLNSSYVPNKNHSRRSDITTFELSGTGYTSGGTTVTLTATVDSINQRVDFVRGVAVWATSEVTAKHAALVNWRSAGATIDELLWVESLPATTDYTRQIDATTVRMAQL